MGGAEHSLLDLLQNLDRRLLTPHLAAPAGKLAEAATQRGITVHLTPLPRLRRSPHALINWHKGIRMLMTLADTVNAAAIYANTVRSAMYAALAARLGQRPFVWHMHDFWLTEERPSSLWQDTLLKQLLCAQAQLIITNSKATADHLPPNYHYVTIYNGIDPDKFRPQNNGRPFRTRFQIPHHAPLVGMVGRLRPWKGAHRFITLAELIHQQMPHVHFVIVGGTPLSEDDSYTNKIHDQAVAAGLGNRCHFTGHLEDVRPALAAIDVFVHPGDPEPFGLVNIEAMAMQKPVVAFAHGALPEIVVEGETGFLVPPGDVSALAAATLKLLQDAQLRQRMGKNGRFHVLQQFSKERMVRQIEQNLLTMIEQA